MRKTDPAHPLQLGSVLPAVPVHWAYHPPESKESPNQSEKLAAKSTSPSQQNSFASRVFDKYSSVRLLVNNAGIETLGYTSEIPLLRWEAPHTS